MDNGVGDGPLKFAIGESIVHPYRNAAFEDLPEIVAIYNATIASRQVTADLEPVSVDSRIDWFHAHAPDSYPLWVVEADNGGIGGWLSFSPFHSRAAYRHTAEISIYIRADQRRRGLGGFLLREAMRRAPGLGFEVLIGLIFGHNQPSLDLFAAANFEQWGLLPEVTRLDGRARDVIIVGRRV